MFYQAEDKTSKTLDISHSMVYTIRVCKSGQLDLSSQAGVIGVAMLARPRLDAPVETG
jgi:hypothetical protein